MEDLTRFNESIDQSLTEAIRGFNEVADEIAAQLAAIIEFSDDAIIGKGLDGVIKSWNRSAERMFGYTAAEAIGQHITLIVPADRRAEEEEVLSRLRRGEVVEHFRTERCAKDGRRLQISLTTSPIKDVTGRVIGASKVARDIGAEIRSEESLRVARAEADDANRAKDIFLATLSHELQTPLNAIVGWMGILRSQGCKEEDLKEGLDVIDRNTKTQVQLIEDVLDVSRIISGKMRLEIRPCNLADCIKAGVDAVRFAAEARGIRLDVKLDPATQAVTCDPARVQQVVWNLLSNAVKFTSKGGTVHVALTGDTSHVQIQISDTGQGIAPDLLPHIFNRFRQATGSTRRKFGGLGLGLSIVKHLIEMHGRTIEAHSEGEGHGSTFTVKLPITAVQKPEDDPAENPLISAGQSTAIDPPPVRLDGVRLMVVDDEADSRRMLWKVLQSVGAIVTAMGSASAALNELGTPGKSPHVFDVLVSDLGMQEQNGYDLIREVRRRGYHPKDLPAVALTGFAHKDDAREAVLAGFQVHIPKPVDVHYLTAVIASLVGRTG